MDQAQNLFKPSDQQGISIADFSFSFFYFFIFLAFFDFPLIQILPITKETKLLSATSVWFRVCRLCVISCKNCCSSCVFCSKLEQLLAEDASSHKVFGLVELLRQRSMTLVHGTQYRVLHLTWL